ncbi:MAG: endonuclease domain-containing protein [Pseudorhodoplanes sp.]
MMIRTGKPDAASPPPLAGEGQGGGSHEETLSSKPTWHVTPKMWTRARSLRRETTDAERIIWSALRAHRLNSASFRRQTPIGPYVADFVCHEARLIVEIDGGQHFEPEQIRKDAKRSAFLEAKGYRILRFTNHDVMINRQGVLESIAAAIENTPSPTLPRKRGRGNNHPTPIGPTRQKKQRRMRGKTAS